MCFEAFVLVYKCIDVGWLWDKKGYIDLAKPYLGPQSSTLRNYGKTSRVANEKYFDWRNHKVIMGKRESNSKKHESNVASEIYHRTS